MVVSDWPAAIDSTTLHYDLYLWRLLLDRRLRSRARPVVKIKYSKQRVLEQNALLPSFKSVWYRTNQEDFPQFAVVTQPRSISVSSQLTAGAPAMSFGLEIHKPERCQSWMVRAVPAELSRLQINTPRDLIPDETNMRRKNNRATSCRKLHPEPTLNSIGGQDAA